MRQGHDRWRDFLQGQFLAELGAHFLEPGLDEPHEGLEGLAIHPREDLAQAPIGGSAKAAHIAGFRRQ